MILLYPPYIGGIFFYNPSISPLYPASALMPLVRTTQRNKTLFCILTNLRG
nr:MAG TPA: hypothetical protein [Caudoviricetes sp.]